MHRWPIYIQTANTISLNESIPADQEITFHSKYYIIIIQCICDTGTIQLIIMITLGPNTCISTCMILRIPLTALYTCVTVTYIIHDCITQQNHKLINVNRIQSTYSCIYINYIALANSQDELIKTTVSCNMLKHFIQMCSHAHACIHVQYSQSLLGVKPWKKIKNIYILNVLNDISMMIFFNKMLKSCLDVHVYTCVKYIQNTYRSWYSRVMMF